MKRPFFDNVISFFFIFAGLYNIVGIVYPTQFFLDQTIATVDPVVFSWLGQVNILLWGLAYLAVSFSFYRVPKLLFIFFIQKMIYAVIGIIWYFDNTEKLQELATNNPLVANFFQFYGIGELCFALFFFAVVVRCGRESKNSQRNVVEKSRIEPTINAITSEVSNVDNTENVKN